MLELRDAQREIVGLVALHEPQPGDQAIDHLVAPEARVLRVTTPARKRVAHGATKLVTVEPDEPREIVRQIVCGLRCQRCPTETGQERGLDRPAIRPRAVSLPVHGTRSSRTSDDAPAGAGVHCDACVPAAQA